MVETKVKGKSGNKVGSKKEGKIIKIDDLRSNKNTNVKVGTVDMYNPTSIYLEISTWTNLKQTKYPADLERWKKQFLKNIRQYIYNTLESGPDVFNSERTVVTSAIPDHQMKQGKSTYISIDINLYQNGNIAIDDETLLYSINRILSGINIFFTLNDYIEFSKTK